MTDIWSREKRSEVMSRIRGQDTVPELLLRHALHSLGLRYRLHQRGVPGRPDVSFKSVRVAVFVHGCFWHGCPDHYTQPRQNAAFWKRKLEMNRMRDSRRRKELAAQGWKVIELWEHQVRKDPERCALRVLRLVEKWRGGQS